MSQAKEVDPIHAKFVLLWHAQDRDVRTYGLGSVIYRRDWDHFRTLCHKLNRLESGEKL